METNIERRKSKQVENEEKEDGDNGESNGRKVKEGKLANAVPGNMRSAFCENTVGREGRGQTYRAASSFMKSSILYT